MQNMHLLAYLQLDVAPEQPLLVAGSYEGCATHPAVALVRSHQHFPWAGCAAVEQSGGTDASEPITIHAMQGWRPQLLGSLSPLCQMGG